MFINHGESEAVRTMAEMVMIVLDILQLLQMLPVVAAWMGTVCDMTVLMLLMMKRYRSEKWRHIKV